LVVDDDEATCITFKNILVKKCNEVVVSHTGEEAIAMVEKKTYDAIFIDMKLPAINGLETYLAIKEINPKAVVIIITAYYKEMADLVEKVLNSHAYTCLHKPLEIEDVLRLIDEIWEKKENRGD